MSFAWRLGRPPKAKHVPSNFTLDEEAAIAAWLADNEPGLCPKAFFAPVLFGLVAPA